MRVVSLNETGIDRKIALERREAWWSSRQALGLWANAKAGRRSAPINRRP